MNVLQEQAILDALESIAESLKHIEETLEKRLEQIAMKQSS